MPEIFHGFVPVVREEATIAESILATTAAMRRSGSFMTATLCWSPAELESLAMFAVDARNRAALAATPEIQSRFPSTDLLPDEDW